MSWFFSKLYIIYIYIYIERERERERHTHTHTQYDFMLIKGSDKPFSGSRETKYIEMPKMDLIILLSLPGT